MAHPDWILKDLKLEKLRNLVIGYAERDSVTAVQALKRVRAVVKAEGEENKDWLRCLHLSPEQHPWPIFSGEEGKAALISHLLDLMGVIESDFEVLKKHLGKEDPKTAPQGVITSRFLLGRFRSRMLQKIDQLVDVELRAQKVDDLGFLIYMARSRTVNTRMVAVVVGLFNNPNPVESLGKLKRLQKCLCDVIAVGREFIVTHRFVPQPKSFPVAKLSQPHEMEQEGSPTSLVLQLVCDADHLIDQVYDCMGVIDDCPFHKLSMTQLEAVEELIKKMAFALEKCAAAEGGVYLLE
ncbi:hypothetical protein YC2023_055806 [Brassica napus]